MRLHVCVVLLFCLVNSDGANILGIFSLPTHSHYVMGSKLLKELAQRGHQVTIIGSSKQKESVENLTEIVMNTEHLIKDAMKISPSFRNDANYFDIADQSLLATLGQAFFIDKLGRLVTEKMLNHPKILDLYNKTFDLIIADIWINQALIGLSDIFHCPFIMFSTVGPNSVVNALVLNPTPYSYVSDITLGFPPQMNFWQRLVNVYLGICHRIYRNVYERTLAESILKKYFKNSPKLEDLQQKYLALILMNSNPVMNYPQPLVPSMIEIGGFHVEKPRPLPKDLQEFMNGAEEGVIMFSLGSLLKSTELPLDKRNAILRTFGKLKQRVVWKYENDTLPGKPGNVKISKWLPVNDLLAHPNLRAFITHGGILSTTEAVHQGVPIIGMPVFFDQFINVENAVERNYALVQPLSQLTEETFTRTIEEIIRNNSYRENAKKFSKILKDQPINPMDKAIFWIEYVIRNKGADHLKTSAHHLHWTQLYLIDVTAFTITFIASIYYLLKILLTSRNKNAKIKTN